MSGPSPIYSPESCRPAYQLNWSLSIFWKADPIPEETWLPQLRTLTEGDGVRILEHRAKDAQTSQFFLSTKPTVSPADAVRSVKGRLQHQIRKARPRAFKGNFSIKSVGETRSAKLEGYLDAQLDRHRMADSEVQKRLREFQIDQSDICLVQTRRSSHGEYLYNLHVVLVYEGRWREVRREHLERSRSMLVRVAQRKGHLLAKARIVADHIHMMVGCQNTESPMHVAVSYMKNIAYAHSMSALFQHGFFVGTFGEYDRGAIRRFL